MINSYDDSIAWIVISPLAALPGVACGGLPAKPTPTRLCNVVYSKRRSYIARTSCMRVFNTQKEVDLMNRYLEIEN
jgi:hypothetical protein